MNMETEVIVERSPTPPSRLGEILLALDKLNRFARSSEERDYGCRFAIYFLKNEAIHMAYRAGITTHRPVKVETKCRGCAGTGRYLDCNGYERDHCWACRSTGRTELIFAETTISLPDASLVWHTPYLKFPVYEVLSEWRDEEGNIAWQEAGDWKPNQPGEGLKPIEVATYLNMVEEYFPARPGPRRIEYGPPRDDFKYDFYLGSTEPGVCCLCKAALGETPHVRFVARREELRWGNYICDGCREERFRGKATWEQYFAIPPALLEPEAIQVWIKRHGIWVAPGKVVEVGPEPGWRQRAKTNLDIGL